ncbi:MAG: hypothetical protein ACLPXB_09925, partial [Thiobacillaceae bacterium]
MVQPSASEQTLLDEGLRKILHDSLNWLRPACTHMEETTRQVGHDTTEVSGSQFARLDTAILMAAIQKKTLDYLTGQNAAVRLALIDQNNYDSLVEETAVYRSEIDQQYTALSFIEKHLGRLMN